MHIVELIILALIIGGLGAWIYFKVIKESRVARATRILEYANEAFRNKNLVSLRSQLESIGEPEINAEITTRNIILILIETLERSGTARVK